MTGLELLKAPEATAGEIADIISAPCPPTIPAHCDGVSCRECWLTWLTGEPPEEKGPSDEQTAPCGGCPLQGKKRELTPRWMSLRSRSCCRRLCSTPILRGGWLRMDEFTALFSRKDMTFEEAVAYFKERVPVTASRFYQIAAEYRALAFTVSGYTKAQVLKKFYDELLAALEEGNSLAEFRENMNDFLEAEGYEGITPYQAENIFRTNIQTAYNVGHYKRMTEPGVKALRPYWQYDAGNDSKTRPSHLAMDGRVFMADDPIWDTWFPPNGFKCRCTVKTLSKRQMEQRGLTVETEAPRAARLEDGRFVNILPDPQFDTNPAKVRYQPDLTGYPEPLKKAYQEREKGNTPP